MDEREKPGGPTNSISGKVRTSLQLGDVHGDVHVDGRSVNVWIPAIVIVVVAIVVAAVIVAIGRTDQEDRPFSLVVRAGDVDGTAGLPQPVFPVGTVSGLPAPPRDECEYVYLFARDHGGTRDRRVSGLAFTIVAGDRPLRVHGIKLVSERVAETPRGEVLDCVPSGGAMTTSWLAVDLDTGHTAYRYPPDDESAGRLPGGVGLPNVPFALELAPDRAERIAVTATSDDCYCRWSLELDVEVDGQHYPTAVTDGGKPFETLPYHGSYDAFSYDRTAGQWRRA